MKSVRIAVVARLEDHKLVSKLRPLATMPEVSELVLFRRTPLVMDGLTCFTPPAWARSWSVLAEPWRLTSLLRHCRGWDPKTSFVISFFLMPHALHADVARRVLGLRAIPVALSQEDVDLAIAHPLISRAVRSAWAVGVRGARSRRRLADSGVPAERVFEPPNVHPLEVYAPAEAARTDLDVVFVGALVAVKQVDVLLRALARVRATKPDLRAAIVGDGELRPRLEGLARQLGLGAAVEFAGARPYSEVPSWLRRARIFVMTSKMEGLPMAMIEALSCGIPVVVPDVGDVTTVARHDHNGLVVSPGTDAEYAEAIGRLLTDESLRARLAHGASSMRDGFAASYSLEAAQAAWRRALFVGEAE